jgi:FkbM family methyltransferase
MNVSAILRILGLLKIYKNWVSVIVSLIAMKLAKKAGVDLRPLRILKLWNDLNIDLSELMHPPRRIGGFYVYIGELGRRGWSIYSHRGLLILEKAGYTLVSRADTGDLVTIFEVFEDRFYGKFFEGMVILDIGAYIGDSAIYFAANGADLVIAVEPDPENYRLALLNTLINKLADKILMIKTAISSESGKKLMIIPTDSKPATKVSIVKDKDSDSNEGFSAISASLDDLVSCLGLNRIDLLKLDCEGCEYEALKKSKVLEIIRHIIIEYHEGPKDLPQILAKNGFYVIEITQETYKQGLLLATREPKELMKIYRLPPKI